MTSSPPKKFDVLVIGGGANGCGIARDAAGRGYSVCLCEANDLGSGTSSATTKLIHGGLRYLEYYEFRLVREALAERETLWRIAPHIIWPLRFVLPYQRGLRPIWILRLGLFLYDHIGGRKLLPPARMLDLTCEPVGIPLKSNFKVGFEYSDCWVMDSRLVVLTARDAQDRGATILPRHKVVAAARRNGEWHVEAVNALSGEHLTFAARVLINAAGPWVDQVLSEAIGHHSTQNVRLVRGSHIVIAKKYEHGVGYTLQNPDGRVIFVLPYEGDYTLIGTTDVDHPQPAAQPRISDGEIDYLCGMASDYFRSPVTRDDIVWTFSGVRPLFDDGASSAQDATRDYVIKTEGNSRSGALINVFGGKITTHRRLAEAILSKVGAILGERRPRWTAGAPLPGGDFAVTGFGELVDRYASLYPFVEIELIKRLTRHYGTRVLDILGEATQISDLGRNFGNQLYECEVRYLSREEFAVTAEDVLFRRTRLGIRMNTDQADELTKFMEGLLAEQFRLTLTQPMEGTNAAFGAEDQTTNSLASKASQGGGRARTPKQ